MVSTSTWRNGAMQMSDSPWLATGDLAQRDGAGQLRFMGRKNQVIVKSSGLNIHPEDVEAVLNAQLGVEGSAVVPLDTASGPEPVAVLLFRGPRDTAQAAVVAANRSLAEFQRVRQWRVWPELDFPRTSTGKIRRGKVTEWVNAQRESADSASANTDPLLALVVAITGAKPASQSDDPRLVEDLQLDSLGRVQLQAEIEQRMGINLGDAALEQAATVGDLRRHLGLSDVGASFSEVALRTEVERQDEIYPRWTWWWLVNAARVTFIECVQQPLVRLLAAPEVRRETKLENIEGPLLLIANHVTAYDLPLALYALPGKIRRHVATAMAANVLEDFREGRNQGSWFLNMFGPLTYFVTTFVFNVFPLPRSAGFRKSFQHAGEALDRGYNVMVFPEGQRSEDGKLQRFRPGIGLLVGESNVPVLPIGLVGLGEMKQQRQRWFRSGRLKIRVGVPITFAPELSAEEITERLRAEIARLIE
jgi:long-chain acyl-CoA synthetase